MPNLFVGLVLYPGCMPAGLFAMADLLTAANLRSGRPLFRVQWVAAEPGPVRCAHDRVLLAEMGLAERSWHALLLPGFWARSIDELDVGIRDNQGLIRTLSRLDPAPALWSYCTGVALAAAAGRLDARTATGTWWMESWLTARHGAVDWQWHHACVTGDDVATASGVHGYLPIANAEIERRVSAVVWRDLARLMVLPRPQPMASMFQRLAFLHSTDPFLLRLRLVVEHLPAAEVAIDRLASVLACSSRTLARHVRYQSGVPVGTYVRLIKLNQAAERLAHQKTAITRISADLGFSDDSSFRRSFKTVTGMTPLEYRQQYSDMA